MRSEQKVDIVNNKITVFKKDKNAEVDGDIQHHETYLFPFGCWPVNEVADGIIYHRRKKQKEEKIAARLIIEKQAKAHQVEYSELIFSVNKKIAQK